MSSSPPATTALKPTQSRTAHAYWPIGFFLLLSASIAATWYSATKAQEEAVLRERGRELQAIAELKIEFIRFWLHERRADAAVQGGMPLMARIAEHGAPSTGPDGADAVRDRLEMFRKEYGYDAVLVLDRSAHYRAGAGSKDELIHALASDPAQIAMKSGKTVVSRAYHSEVGGSPHADIDIATPIFSGGRDKGRIVGTLVFHLDPLSQLNPILQQWPAPSASGETFLVEQAGGEIIFLSTLRHAPAERLHKSTAEDTLPAAMAARGQHGVTEGLDYRGVPVLAAIGHVPETSWYVVAKIDRDEVLAPVRREALWSGTLSALLVLALGLTMFSWHRRSRSELALTRQTTAKEALAVSEARFRKLLDNAWDLHALLDRNMVIRYASPTMDRYLGHDSIGQGIGVGTARVHPDDVARVEEARRAALKQPGIPQPVEHRLSRNDGGWLTFEASFTSHFDDPDIGALSYAARDITDRIAAEDALHRERSLVTRIAATAPGVICSFRLGRDGAASFPYASPRIEEIYGLPAEQLAKDAAPVFALTHPEDVGHVHASIGESARSMRPWHDEFRVRRPGRTEIWVEGRSMPERQPDGGVIWHGFLHDITERKQAEAALRESEQRFRALFERAPIGISIAGPDRRYLMVNPAQCRLLGYSEAELLDMHYTDVTHPDDVTLNVEKVNALLDGSVEHFSMEKRYVRKNGKIMWASLNVVAVVDANGGTLYTIGLAEDITEKREAEKKRLAIARQQRDALVREVHHRIKNHLQGLAGLLRRHMAQQPALQPVLETFAAQINALSVVHGLQGRTEEGKASLNSLVTEIAAFLGGVTGVQIKLEKPAHDCKWAIAEEESVPLALIVNELLTNALRHRAGGADPANAAPVSFSIRCNAQGARMLIRNPGRLAPEVDFPGGKGLGTGLGLIRALLPPSGIAVSLSNLPDGSVGTQIDLAEPILMPMAPDQVVSRR